jgi:hypothetical protein
MGLKKQTLITKAKLEYGETSLDVWLLDILQFLKEVGLWQLFKHSFQAK